MFLKNTRAASAPPRVIIEELPDKRRVLLASDAREITDEDGNISVEYDEVVFELPKTRTETASAIEAQFDAWWAYGAQEQEAPPDLEQRVSDLEELVLELLEG